MNNTDQVIVAVTEVPSDLSLQPTRTHAPVITITEAQARVSKGAQLLDRQRPGWASEIDLSRLSLINECWCVLGQLEGQFVSAAKSRWGESPSEWATPAAEHGFHIGQHVFVMHMTHEELEHQYGLLQDAWIEAIADRLV